MTPFRTESSNHVVNAQRNLMGRTHYVDPDTLRFHKSRVVSSHVVDNGLLFSIVTRDALDYEGSKRGYRFAIFDVAGQVIERTALENAYTKRDKATAAMWRSLDALDVAQVTTKAIAAARKELEQAIAQVQTALMENTTRTS